MHTKHVRALPFIYKKNPLQTSIGVHQTAQMGRQHFLIKKIQFIHVLEESYKYLTGYGTIWWPINIVGNFLSSEGKKLGDQRRACCIYFLVCRTLHNCYPMEFLLELSQHHFHLPMLKARFRFLGEDKNCHHGLSRCWCEAHYSIMTVARSCFTDGIKHCFCY